jgi:hypothetical protein
MQFRVGDHVRLRINIENPFKKGRSNWSRDVWTITGTNGHHRFILDDPEKTHALAYDLQLVSGEPQTAPVLEQPPLDKEPARKAKKQVRAIRKEGIQNFLGSGKQDELASAKRAPKAPEVFEAKPAPAQQTLDRSHLGPKRKLGPRKGIDPDSIHFTQSRLDSRKFHYGKVSKQGTKYVSVYDDGRTVSYTPEELIKVRFPLTKADVKNLPRVRKLLGG